MTILCNSQQIRPVPTTLAGFQLNGTPYFGLPAQDIRCLFYEGSSSYGSMLCTGGQTDVYIAAAVISKDVGTPVRLQWMRWDEHGWDCLRPGRDVRRHGRRRRARQHHRARLDALRAGRHDAPDRRPSWPARHLAGDPGNGGPTTADTTYRLPRQTKRVLAKTVPLYGGSFKSDPLRAPNAPQPTSLGSS